MRISVSRKHAKDDKPVVVLECSTREYLRHRQILREKVLGHRRPVMEQDGDRVRYLFARKYLPVLTDLFASAEQSASVQRWLARRDKEMFGNVLPARHIPGLVETDDRHLFPFQRWGAAVAASRPAFFLHDDMGLGKSVQALCALALRQAYPALVVCPNSVKAVWAEQVATWFPERTTIVVDGSAYTRRMQILTPADITIINYEALRLHPELAEYIWEAVVVDEHHRVKNIRAKQTLALLAIEADYKLLLSGTPILNGRLEELWPPLHYAYPDDFPGDLEADVPDWRFRSKHCIVRRGKIVGYKNISTLRTQLHERSLRRRKEEVLPELPAKIYSVRHVKLKREQRKLYNSIKEEMLLWLDDGKSKRITDIRAQVTRLKQACFSPELYGGSKKSAKIEELLSLVQEITDAGHKVIIFSQWAKATRIIARELQGYTHAYVDGKVPVKKRAAEIARFQEDPECVLYIGTIGANKEGITLTAASYVIFTDLDWVPANNDQAANRAHRIGQHDTVNVIELQAEKTVEERIALLLQDKEEMNAFMTERGAKRPTRRKTLRAIGDVL